MEKELMLEKLEISRCYTLEVARAMPLQSYTCKPEGVEWDFAQLMNHIGYGLHWWGANYVLGREVAWEPPVSSSNKEEVLVYLTQAFEGFEQMCRNLPLTRKSEEHGFNATLDHITHHRGQAVIYLRGCGIQPPDYTY